MLLALGMVLHLNPLMRFPSPPTRFPNPHMKHPNLPIQLPSHPMRSPSLPTTRPATTPVEMLVILERLATTSTTTTPRLPTPGRRLSSVTASTWRTTIRSRGTLRDLSPCSQTLGESHHQATPDSDSLGREAAEALTWIRLLLNLESLSLLMKTMMKMKLKILTPLMLKSPKQKKVQRRFQPNLHSSLLRTGRRGAQMVFVRHVLPTQLTERVGHPEPFGPAGFRPPTCGGPGSGYVCCSVPGTSSSLDVGFGELQQLQQTGNTIRDIRQQPEQFSQALNSVATTSQQQFSQYGQCGKRNAHGVNGRINNPAQRYADGDTEFGEYPWQVAILKKEQYDNVCLWW